MKNIKIILAITILSTFIVSCSKDDEGTQPQISQPTVKDIYICGVEKNGSNDAIKYWKNGIGTFLTDGTKAAYDCKIAMFENNLYVCGTENNGVNNVAKYWKNGVVTNLSDGTKDANVTSISVANNDVYISGNERTTGGFAAFAKYWKNGVATNLSDGTKYALASDIFVVGNDVYVCGREYNGSKDIARFWKNGVVTVLTNGTNYSYANAIEVSQMMFIYVVQKEMEITMFLNIGKMEFQ